VQQEGYEALKNLAVTNGSGGHPLAQVLKPTAHGAHSGTFALIRNWHSVTSALLRNFQDAGTQLHLGFSDVSTPPCFRIKHPEFVCSRNRGEILERVDSGV